MPDAFGRYQLLKKLAVGGMGEVWLARQKGMVGFEKLVVVKRLLAHLAEEQEFINMFFDEARIAAVLNHPNIAQIYDLGEVNGEYYIAMEYVHGENLRVVAQQALDVKGGMPLALKCRVVADAAAALEFAHHAVSPSGQSLNLIHRDVSPQNIIVAFSGAVKLIDFGVAKAAGKVTKTATGIIKGKYAYMSPEQAKGEELDSRSDLYGLGIVLYELLTNQRLFKRENDTETLKAVVYDRVQPPSAVVKGIPKALDPVVMKALERDRRQRYQTAQEFQLALEEFLVRQRLPATPVHLSAYVRELFPEEAGQTFGDEPARTPSPGGGTPLGEEHSPSSEVHPKPAKPVMPPPPERLSKRQASLPTQLVDEAAQATVLLSPAEAARARKSAPKERSSKSGLKAQLHAVQSASQSELELRIQACSSDDLVNGFFLNALLGLGLRLAGAGADTTLKQATSEPKAYVDALMYPTTELLRMLWRAVELLTPKTGSVEGAFEDMGVWAMDGLVRSPLGRPLEQLDSRSPHQVLKALTSTLKPMLRPGERVLGPVTDRSAMVILKGEVLPIQFHAGLFRAALQRLCGLEPKARWEKTAADRVEMTLGW
ncbi:MAG: TIGR02265 family protein [Myxococcaceae bacterium]|nr:TIGR02265 family protein [Myxococcaceae bacterium]